MAKPDAGAELRAQTLFEKALALDDSLAGAHHDLGKLLLRNGKARHALPHLEAAARLDPSSSRFWLTLANAYKEVERDDDHRKALET
jgi:Flp pilus assembly protein TadD